MATSSDLQPKQSTPPGSPQDAEWRILAEEAAQENNPNKLIEIIEALNRAVNEQEQHKKKAVSTSHSDSQHSTDNVQSIDSSRHFRKSKTRKAA